MVTVVGRRDHIVGQMIRRRDVYHTIQKHHHIVCIVCLVNHIAYMLRQGGLCINCRKNVCKIPGNTGLLGSIRFLFASYKSKKATGQEKRQRKK